MRAPGPTAASSSWSTRIRSCRRTTRRSAPSTRPGWPRWTRSPPPAPPTEARTASRRTTSRSSRSCSTDPAMTTPPPPYGAYPPPPPGAYPGHYGYPRYPQPQPTNALAIASLVCAFLFAPLGIIFGHISLSQINKTGEEARGLAVAGLVSSYLITVLTILVVVLSVLFAVQVARDLDSLDGLTPQHPGFTATPSPANDLPPFKPPKTLGSNCQYPATTESAGKPVKPPQNGRIATDPIVLTAEIVTAQGVIGL